MLATRGVAVFAAGLALWLAARAVGSGDLHIVAVGVTLLPFIAAAFTRLSRQRLTLERRIGAATATVGQRVTVELEVENHSVAPTSFLLLSDRVPPELGTDARLVLTGIPGRNRQRVSYTVACRSRGRWQLGPASIDMADPFALTRVSLRFAERGELLVYPEIEELGRQPVSPFGAAMGESAARHLYRTGEEFYTMREYQIGDDLRRIHWPSVARRGKLMIRQDESARRSTATVFLDTRISALGEARTPAFERAVSVAASIGAVLARAGFTLRLAAGGTPPQVCTEDTFLETLAVVRGSPAVPLASMLAPLRSGSVADSTLVAVTAPPHPAEVATLSRTGTMFGPKIAVLVYPAEPSAFAPEQRAELEARASSARLSLTRAGWEVYVLPPSGRLKDRWRTQRIRHPGATVSSR